MLLQRHAARFVTGALAVALYVPSVPHETTTDEAAAMASPFHFEAIELPPSPSGVALRNVRDVHPALKHMRAWISSVGAGAALADIAGIGHPADICLVDPRDDSVTVMPAPGTGNRYKPFVLPLPSEGYDPNTIAPMGCLPADVNEDGRLDLVIYYWGRTPVAFLQSGDGPLSAEKFKPVEIVTNRERWFTNAAIFADIDGDGHPDLLFGNYFRDGDRILDANATDVVEMQHSMSRAYNGGRKHLLLWQSASTDGVIFKDASDVFTQPMATGWTLALGAADLNGDLLPEIYIANDFGPDRLLLNKSTPGHPAFEIVEGRRDLVTPRSKVLGQDSFKGMGVDFGDLDGSGRPAIAVSNISETYALLESHFLFESTGDDEAWKKGYAPYHDRSSGRGTWTGGWGWDIKFADLNNDGRLEILQANGFVKGEVNRWPELQEMAMANDELLKFPWAWHRFDVGADLSGHDHDRLFVPDAAGRYHDIWPQLGLDRDSISRGIALGDVDGDGRLSAVIARQWMPSVFLRNLSPNVGAAMVLDLRLRGVAGTRAAIGATARVVLTDGRVVTGQVDGGNGHSGKRASEIHLGLGHVPEGAQLNVDVAWRDSHGLHRRTFKLTPGRHQIVLGGAEVAETLPAPHL